MNAKEYTTNARLTHYRPNLHRKSYRTELISTATVLLNQVTTNRLTVYKEQSRSAHQSYIY